MQIVNSEGENLFVIRYDLIGQKGVGKRSLLCNLIKDTKVDDASSYEETKQEITNNAELTGVICHNVRIDDRNVRLEISMKERSSDQNILGAMFVFDVTAYASFSALSCCEIPLDDVALS